MSRERGMMRRRRWLPAGLLAAGACVLAAGGCRRPAAEVGTGAPSAIGYHACCDPDPNWDRQMQDAFAIQPSPEREAALEKIEKNAELARDKFQYGFDAATAMQKGPRRDEALHRLALAARDRKDPDWPQTF